jgi:NADP-dependent aldehyde dehydrogenase
VVECKNVAELTTLIKGLEGQLTGTILGSENALEANENLVMTLQSRVGRLIFNGVPTGVEVCAAMQHGGPFPASTDERFTAVGVKAMDRWLRPVSYQNWPDKLLPKALQNNNPLGLTRLINGNLTKD